jgi:hypothetical protein
LNKKSNNKQKELHKYENILKNLNIIKGELKNKINELENEDESDDGASGIRNAM